MNCILKWNDDKWVQVFFFFFKVQKEKCTWDKWQPRVSHVFLLTPTSDRLFTWTCCINEFTFLLVENQLLRALTIKDRVFVYSEKDSKYLEKKVFKFLIMNWQKVQSSWMELFFYLLFFSLDFINTVDLTWLFCHILKFSLNRQIFF